MCRQDGNSSSAKCLRKALFKREFFCEGKFGWGTVSLHLISSSRASRELNFQKKKELYDKERICLSNVRKATDQRDAQTMPSAVPWWWCDLAVLMS